VAFGSIFADADVGPADLSGSSSVDLAFGPPSSSNGDAHPLHPTASGFGLAFWLGVGGLVALCLIRRSLPA
jgi:hypothetical protein